MNTERFIKTLVALSLVVLLLPVTDASARTWRVEKDGSGDFAVIQEAVDVAASGDTVRIGVGRFDDKRYFTSPGWSDSVRVIVHQYELTIIGSGPETIIGQEEPWELEQGNHRGIVAGQLAGVLDNSILRVQDLHLENMGRGIDTSHEIASGCKVEIYRCSFYANWYSVTLYSAVGGEVQVIECSFDNIARDGIQIHCWGQDKFTMRECTSRLMYIPPWTRTHFGVWGVSETFIEDCEFIGGTACAIFTYSGPAIIRNCRFEGQLLFALNPDELSTVTVEYCEFQNQERVLESPRSSNDVTIRNCVVRDVDDCAFLISYTGGFVAHDNDITHGARGAVWVDDIPNCDTPRTLDMTNNYWGTDIPDSIAAWIHDRNDSDQACFYVDFEPFRPESTPVEQRSLSDLKGLFR